jgi:protein O-mannosyl-transferase
MKVSVLLSSKLPFKGKHQLWAILFIFASILVFYWPVFQLAFTNFDDQRYITENPQLHSSFKNAVYFFAHFFDGHYHPLTMLSLMLDYSLGVSDTFFFHLHNFILHVLNAILVFLFVQKLTRNSFLGLLTALLWSLSPMSVESVAWVSERKNLLYVLFYLLSLLAYLEYKNQGHKKYYFLCLLAFLFSCLSKAQAITLPLILILIDFYIDGFVFKWSVVKNKLSFFVIAILFGIVAQLAQQSFWPDLHSDYSMMGRLAFSAMAFSSYLFKLLAPFNLSAIYPYPVEAGQSVPAIYYLFFAPVFLFLFFLFYKIKKNRALTFSLLFFGINIFFLLKINGIPYGDYYMADRYSYLASIGIYFLLAFFFFKLMQSKKKFQYWLIFGMACYLLFFGLKTREQTKVWQNGASLWQNVLEQYPDLYQAWNDLGNAEANEGNKTNAMKAYAKTIEINPQEAAAYNNRATLHARLGEFEAALPDFNKAISLKEDYTEAYINRAMLYERSGQWRRAIEDYKKVTRIRPGFVLAYLNLSKVYQALGQQTEALKAVRKAIDLQPNLAQAYFERASILMAMKDFEAALKSLDKAEDLGLNNTQLNLNKGIILYQLKRFELAIQHLKLVLNKNQTEASKYLGFSYYNQQKFDLSIQYLNMALLKIKDDPILFAMRGMANLQSGENEKACADLEQAYQMGLKSVEKQIAEFCQ